MPGVLAPIVLVTYLWVAPNGNMCASTVRDNVPVDIQVVTEERITLSVLATEKQITHAIKYRALRNALAKCPREKDKDA